MKKPRLSVPSVPEPFFPETPQSQEARIEIPAMTLIIGSWSRTTAFDPAQLSVVYSQPTDSFIFSTRHLEVSSRIFTSPHRSENRFTLAFVSLSSLSTIYTFPSLRSSLSSCSIPSHTLAAYSSSSETHQAPFNLNSLNRAHHPNQRIPLSLLKLLRLSNRTLFQISLPNNSRLQRRRTLSN